ncbi:helix-turn-helix domain-containing protein [Paenibacillus farraposensis]
MGLTFQQYLTQLRLARAAQQLKTSGSAIETIAFASGFTSMRAFDQHFRETYHCTPRAYRDRG